MIALYGLDGGFPLTLQEVSIEIGISREMIRQIRKKTLTNLKKQLTNSNIVDCL
jgi:DNA-directed RNA polymerase sigma subunit (sigma70/sigma32)